MFLSGVRVMETEEVVDGCFSLLLEGKNIAVNAYPGQFIHMRIADNLLPFLRRPFSLAETFPEEGLFRIIFRLIGAGTKILSRVRRGDVLDCLGPLGTGFKPCEDLRLSILVGGGIGVAPLLFLAKKLQEKGNKVIMYYGASQSADLIPVHQFLPPGVEINLATEDGSSGFPGFVTDLFQTHLQNGLLPEEIFACGPRLMLQKLAEVHRNKKIPMQFSLEEMMACGIGACLGCSVEMQRGENETVFKRVCRDGPVFKSCEVVW